MRPILAIILVFGAAQAIADERPGVMVAPDGLKEPVYIHETECQGTGVEMRKGQLSVLAQEAGSVICNPDKSKPNRAQCFWFDGKMKQYAAGELTVVSMGGMTMLGDSTSQIVINLTSQVAYSISNFVLHDGLIRGSKTCSGTFRYDSELSEKPQKAKTKPTH